MLYIIGAASVLLLLLMIVYIYRCLSSQKEITESVKKERERGITPTWGTKVLPAAALDQLDQSSESNDSRTVNQRDNSDN